MSLVKLYVPLNNEMLDAIEHYCGNKFNTRSMSEVESAISTLCYAPK